MIQKIMDSLKQKYSCVSVDAGVFANVVIEGAKFKICAYDVKGIGRVATIEMKRLIGLWEMQSLIITPFEKDMPIYYYNRHREKGNYIYRVEMFDTQMDAVDVSDIVQVVAKYASLPDEPQKERWYDEMKLLGSAVKIVDKKSKEELSPMILEHFEAYMKLLEQANDCKEAQKKKKVAVFVNDLCNNSGIAIIEIFLANYGKQVTEKLANEVLFGLK